MSAFPGLPPEASEHAAQVDWLFFALIGVSSLIVLLVLALVVGFSIRYRAGSPAPRGRLPEFMRRDIEIGWTAATLFAFLFIFWWAGATQLTSLTHPSHPLQVHAVGKQWMWKISHENGAREINELHVPAGVPVRVVLTSQDVIHSFYIPALRIKQDAVPGTTRDLWFTADRPGTYHLLCAEFCGTNHSRMRGDVVVLSKADYSRWLADQPQTVDLAAEGEHLFRTLGCSGCHAGASSVHAPLLNGLYGRPVPLSDGTVVSADERYIRDSILQPKSQVAAGYAPIMPSYKTLLSEEELLRLTAYIKSLADEPAADGENVR